jgi:TPR repeat protein
MPPNLGQSVTWLKQAADQGDPTAQFNLGVLYSSGRGVPKDPVQAYMWTDLAASSGDPSSLKLLTSLRTTTTPAQIAEAQQQERLWKPNVKYSWSIK